MALIDIRRSRFLEEGYNLDVCYVTDRIIVMGFPAGATEGYYRNRASKVKTYDSSPSFCAGTNRVLTPTQ